MCCDVLYVVFMYVRLCVDLFRSHMLFACYMLRSCHFVFACFFTCVGTKPKITFCSRLRLRVRFAISNTHLALLGLAMSARGRSRSVAASEKSATSSKASAKSRGSGKGRASGGAGGKGGRSASRKSKKGEAEELEEARSFDHVAIAAPLTKVPWGTICMCEVCSVRSNEVEGWGQVVEVQGKGQQPVGQLCGHHHAVRRSAFPWMSDEDFASRYHDHPAFAHEVDQTINKEPSTIASIPGLCCDNVTEEDAHYLVVESPKFMCLRATDVPKMIPNGDPQDLGMPSAMLPSLTGAHGVEQYYLAGLDNQCSFPTAKVVSVIGAKRKRHGLEQKDHIVQSQAQLLFHHQNAKRMNATDAKAMLAMNVMSLKALREVACPTQDAADTLTHTPSPQDVTMECESEGRTDRTRSSPPFKRQKSTSNLCADLELPATPAKSPRSQATGSAEDHEAAPEPVDDDDDCVSIDSRKTADHGPEFNGVPAKDNEKTTYWILQNNLVKWMQGVPLGVASHQMDKLKQRMVDRDEANPLDQQHASDIARLKAHVKKVSAAKQLRKTCILELSDSEYHAALLTLGPNFAFPNIVCVYMLKRMTKILRKCAVHLPYQSLQQQFKCIAELMKPRTLSAQPTAYDPKLPTLASCPLCPGDLVKAFVAEIVDANFVPLLGSKIESDERRLLAFVNAILSVYETFWEECEPKITKIVGEVCLCARITSFLMASSEEEGGVLADESMYQDLKEIQAAASGGPAGVLSTLAMAMCGNDKLHELMCKHAKIEKSVMVAAPLLQEHSDKLAFYKHMKDCMTKECCAALADACDFVVQWTPKFPQQFRSTFTTFEAGIREKYMTMGKCFVADAQWEKTKGFGELLNAFSKSLEKGDLVFSLDNEFATLKTEVLENPEHDCQCKDWRMLRGCRILLEGLQGQLGCWRTPSGEPVCRHRQSDCELAQHQRIATPLCEGHRGAWGAGGCQPQWG